MPLAQLPRGAMQACMLGGREIVLCHTRAGVFALDNICTHAEARLSEGRLRKTRIVCPLHGAAFDLRDGRVLCSPAVHAVRAHPVRIHSEQVEVDLSERALPG